MSNDLLKETLAKFFPSSVDMNKRMYYEWVVGTIADCIDGLPELENKKALLDDCKKDPMYIMQRVTEIWEKEIEAQAEREGLCPECLTQLTLKIKTCHSNGWDEPPGSWDEAVGAVCGNCGWEGEE